LNLDQPVGLTAADKRFVSVVVVVTYGYHARDLQDYCFSFNGLLIIYRLNSLRDLVILSENVSAVFTRMACGQFLTWSVVAAFAFLSAADRHPCPT
jgi:hypothetical protein